MINNLLTKEQSAFIKSLLSSKNITLIKNKKVANAINLSDSINIYNKNNNDISIHNLSAFISYRFNPNEIKKYGITFTPSKLVDFMYKDVLNRDLNELTNFKIADLSVGNGIFLSELLILLKEKNPNFKLIPFIENNLYGYDIKPENVELAKLILSTICVYYGEDKDKIKFNIFSVDTINLYLNKGFSQKFDLIVGNPPYVKQQNIDKNYRLLLKDNFSTISSNYNLYYAFIEIALNLLTKNGEILYLVPNYLLKIKSALNLRKYILSKNAFHRIVDFKSTSLFSGIGTYSMILNLKKESNNTQYKVPNNHFDTISSLELQNWNTLKINNPETINLTSKEDKKIIDAVQGQIYGLDISTGISTQKDKLYLIDNYTNNANHYDFFKTYNGKQYHIESDIVMEIIRGSGTSKNNIKKQFIIYPYIIKNNTASLLNIEILKSSYPDSYKYFNAVKAELKSRSGISSNDNKDWYKYGRSQALTKTMPKIVFPTNTNKPQFKYIDDFALFYNGYAIYGIKGKISTPKDMKCLELLLNSSLIDKFMKLTSYYIGGGYVSYQKKYLSKVTIPYMTEEQKIELLNIDDSSQRDKFIWNLYGLN